jgi:hypothetical protein
MSEPTYKVEQHEGGRLFHLRNDVKLLCKRSGSGQQVQVELWRDPVILPPDIGNLFSSSFRTKVLSNSVPALFDGLGQGEKKTCAAQLKKDLDAIAVLLNTPTSGGQTMHAAMGDDHGQSVTERLVRYARKGATFFHTPTASPMLRSRSRGI